MSIWCSGRTIGHELDWEPDPDDEPTGEVRSYATGWSNHYPTTDGDVERPANVDTAHIPAWCVPGYECDGDGVPPEWHYHIGPWLRLSISSWAHEWASGGKTVTGREDAEVVMDEAAVRCLVEDLTRWLNTPKARPAEARS